MKISDESVNRLLEGRHEIELEWNDPWKCIGPEGNELFANVKLRATVHDCVNLQRTVFRDSGLPFSGNDAEILLDFIVVHWTEEVKNEH